MDCTCQSSDAADPIDTAVEQITASVNAANVDAISDLERRIAELESMVTEVFLQMSDIDKQ